MVLNIVNPFEHVSERIHVVRGDIRTWRQARFVEQRCGQREHVVPGESVLEIRNNLPRVLRGALRPNPASGRRLNQPLSPCIPFLREVCVFGV